MADSVWTDEMEIVGLDDLTEERPWPEAGPALSAADAALAVCVNARGRVDLPYMSQISGLPVPELIKGLRGAIFQDPEGYDRHGSEEEDWLLRGQYLSGNLRDKLAAARRMERKYRRFRDNISALEAVMPEPLSFDEIGVCLGSPWVPTTYYQNFAREVLKLRLRPHIRYSPELGQWKVEARGDVESSVENRMLYGTARLSALRILEMTLNAQTVKVFDTVQRRREDGKVVKTQALNRAETIAAQEKQTRLEEAFQSWLRQDRERMDKLEDLYYRSYGCILAGRYDGAFLTLPGLNPEVKLYPHQRAAVARIVLSGDVLLDHAVGSGKTYEIVAGVHERKRMGLSGKNLVVAPNNVLDVFADSHRLLYPQDPILVIRPEDFRPAHREEALEEMRDGDYVAVYMAYSSFEMIHLSVEYRVELARERIRQTRAAAERAREKWERAALERQAERLAKELERGAAEWKDDPWPGFDRLGVTTLVVDEAHNFKNISLNTRTDGVVGMHAAGSRRCDELLEKARLVRARGGSVIFATGTPLTNSLADLFVLQAYLQPEQLKLLGLERFDRWVSCFARRQTGFEIDVDSQSFRVMTRFSRFHNLPELTGLFANVCDFYSGENSGMGLPRCGKPIDTVVPRTPEQRAYIETLVERTERIRAKLVRRDEDNLLKVTGDGRLAALDIRLVEPESAPDPTLTKAYACARNVWACYRAHPGTAQLIFCDSGTPKQGFNLYDEVRDRLVELGVPREEIAFVHWADTEAKRRRLFRAVNEGLVRVLLGSTAKLGTGVNVQQKLVAIHHLDVPWRPSDMVQREGRMLRQGNTNPEVYIYRYITAGTFDAYSWQILENKQRFISQFLSDSASQREARDLADAVLSYAEIKALAVGDPLLKTRVETANLLERARTAQRQREKELAGLRQVVEMSPERLKNLKARRERLAQDARHYAGRREELGREERTAFGEELLDALSGNACQARERKFDDLHGFSVLLPAGMEAERPFVVLESPTGGRYPLDMKDAKAMGCVQRAEHLLGSLADRAAGVQREEQAERRRCKSAKESIQEGNPFAEQAARLNEELIRLDEELSRRAEEPGA